MQFFVLLLLFFTVLKYWDIVFLFGESSLVYIVVGVCECILCQILIKFVNCSSYFIFSIFGYICEFVFSSLLFLGVCVYFHLVSF